MRGFFQEMKNKGSWIIFAVCALSFAAYFMLFSKGPFEFDSADILLQMRDKAISQHGATFTLPSLLIIIIAFFKDKLFPWSSDLNVLLTATAFISCIASLVIYQLFKKIFGALFALIYACFNAFVPIYFLAITYGRIDHALAFIFLPFAIYYCINKRWLISSLFCGLTILCRPEAIFVPCGFFIYILLCRFEDSGLSLGRKALLAFTDFLKLSCPAIALWILVSLLIGREKWFQEIFLKVLFKQFTKIDSLDMAVVSRIDIRQIYEGLRIIFGMFKVVLVFAVFGLILHIKRGKLKELFLFLASFLVLLVYVTNIEGTTPRYLIMPIFFLLYLIVYGIIGLCKKTWIVITVASLCVGYMLSYVIPIAYPRHKNAFQVDFARYTESIVETNSVIIVQDEWVFFKYYTKLQLLIPPTDCDREKWKDFLTQVVTLIVSGRPVYLISNGLTYDPCLIFRNFADENFNFKRVGEQFNENWHIRAYIKPHLFKEGIFKVYLSRPIP